MILVERSARVGAPIEAVWDVVQRADQLPEWLAGVRQAEVVSGEGVGRRQLVQSGRAPAVEAEVIAYQEPTLLGWRERPKGAGARAEARTEVYVQLAPDGDGTAVRLIVVRWGVGAVSKALRRWSVRRMGAGLENSLLRLTDLAAPVGDARADGPAPAELRLADLLTAGDRDRDESDPDAADEIREPAVVTRAGDGSTRVVARARLKC